MGGGEGGSPGAPTGLASVHDHPAASRAAAAGPLAVADGPDPAAHAGSLSGAGSLGSDGAAARPAARAALTGRRIRVVAMRFADRRAAGRALGERLSTTDFVRGETVVLGLPRGGVLVAAGVAAALGAPLDVLVVRKLGLPWQPELAMGAIAAVGDTVETVRVDAVLAAAGVDPDTFEKVRQQELGELRRREAAYRDGRPPVAVAGRSVVVVDDGLATGATMRAAVIAVRRQAPRDITAAVPIGSPTACSALADDVDDMVCLSAPRGFRAVGQGYTDFSETSDAEVRAALAAAAGPPA
jgi:predicted phosphoribosyltransferase